MRIRIDRKRLFKLIFFISSLLITLLTNRQMASATCYSCCAGLCGINGCRSLSKLGYCYDNEVQTSCSGSPMCCDPGACIECGTPTCETGYQTTANSCPTKDFTCTGTTECFESPCGQTKSITCYKQLFLVDIITAGGTCTADHNVCYQGVSTAPNCTRAGYTLSSYSQSGCGGSFNSSTGVCSSVTQNMTVTANWVLANQTPTAPTSLLTEGATNPTGVTDLTPEFSAIYNDPDSGDIANYYEIEVNTNSAFSGTVMWDTGKTSMANLTAGNRVPDKSYAGTALSLNGTTYYWRIRFWDDSGSLGAWSAVAYFTMNTSPNTPTSLLTEGATNPTGVTDLTPEFSAIYNDPDSGDIANYYEIEVNTNSAFSGTVMWDTGKTSMANLTAGNRVPDKSYAGTALSLNGTTYYWRIRFWDDSGSLGAWSAVAYFTMNTSPNTPATPYCNGATNPTNVTTANPTFSAIFSDPDSPDTGNYYEIEVNTSSDFDGNVKWDTGIQSMTATTNGSRSPNFTYAGTTLSLNGATYYWRIRFGDNNGTMSGWSATQNFVTCTACIPTSCPTGTSETGTYGFYQTYTCSNACSNNSRTCNCTSSCTPTSCPTGTSETGTHGTYATYICLNACNVSNSRICKCDSSCIPTTCPVGTSETSSYPVSPFYPVGVTDPYNTYNCSNSCGESISKSCFCQICTTAPACGPIYSSINLSFGKVPDSLTPSCRNGSSSTPSQTLLCSLTYRDCYCQAFKICPTPLLNHNMTYPDLILEGFRENTNVCNVSPVESEDDCYEVFSTQPTETLSIDSTQAVKNDFGFSSSTYTGDYEGEGKPDTIIGKQGHLNDPISPINMVAKYTDTDGASDIEGIFIWFRDKDKYTGTPDTPILQTSSATPKTVSTDSWGFMLRRIDADWIPYVPSYGTSNYWTKLPTSVPIVYPYTFSIYGPTAEKMVDVTIIEKPSESGNEITMKYSLKFSDNNGDLFGGENSVSAGTYKVWTMGLDKFSFTPYDNYSINYGSYWTSNYTRYPDTTLSNYWKPEELRYKTGQEYARAWTDSGISWTLDFTDPEVIFSKTIEENIIQISWNASDDRSLYAVIGNIYTNAASAARQIDLDVDGTPSSPISLINGDGVFIPGAIGSNVAGNLSNGWSFKVEPNLNSLTNSGVINIKVQNNISGIFSIYLHVFDDAGNVTMMSLSENLADRLLTGGGLAYSSGGITFAQLTPEDDTMWTNSTTLPPYASPSEGVLRKNAGFTSEMVARDGSTLDVLSNSSISKSYAINRYINDPISNTTSFYDSLLKKYELSKKDLGVNISEHYLLSSSINFLPTCSTTYCTYLRTQDSPNDSLIIESDLVCDKKALIFVKGDLIINPPLYNSESPDSLSNSDGCIFVVGGNVNIAAGTNMSGNFGYDKVNAFIVSDGVITIGADSLTSPDIVDGVYINGGLISRGRSMSGDNPSIDILRYLRLEERLVYPVFAIDLHPKYGILAEQFFGNSYVIHSTEVGLKPY